MGSRAMSFPRALTRSFRSRNSAKRRVSFATFKTPRRKRTDDLDELGVKLSRENMHRELS